jgi:MoaA/NifB/PqqE/SkfB family radical SAM enzyme
LLDHLQHHTLDHLHAKRHTHQVSNTNPPLQFRRQVIIKLPTHSGHINDNAHKKHGVIINAKRCLARRFISGLSSGYLSGLSPGYNHPMLTAPFNLFKLARSDRHLDPLVAIYYLTEQCNLNCAYCEDFGARRNPDNQTPLPLEQVIKILRVIRSGVDTLMLTGGEPLTHPDIDQIILRTKKELKFRDLTMISNGFLLPQHETALTCVDRLIISLDSIDPRLLSQTIGVPLASAQTIIANVIKFASLQTHFGYRMIINAVLTPETLPAAPTLIEFCKENRLLVSFSPQAVNNWPRYELTVSPYYKSFIEKLLQLKQNGAPILGSDAYLRTLSTFQPYDCFPTLAPRIYPNGDLSYPCRPLEKAGNGQGGRQVNLLNTHTWAEAWAIAREIHGQPPRTCHSCFQQCYAEPSLMQAQPLQLLQEWLRCPSSRKGRLPTYAPG